MRLLMNLEPQNCNLHNTCTSCFRRCQTLHNSCLNNRGFTINLRTCLCFTLPSATLRYELFKHKATSVMIENKTKIITYNHFQESTFHHFWGQAMTMLKMCFQKLLLTISRLSREKYLKIHFRRVLFTISGAKERKCSKSIAGGHF